MNQSSSLAIVLAAGKGTRMNQKIPKPLVPISGNPIILWIVNFINVYTYRFRDI